MYVRVCSDPFLLTLCLRTCPRLRVDVFPGRGPRLAGLREWQGCRRAGAWGVDGGWGVGVAGWGVAVTVTGWREYKVYGGRLAKCTC